MRILIFFCFLFIFWLPVQKKHVNSQSEGIDSEEGEAEMFFNKTYSEHQTSLEQKIFRGYNAKTRPVKNGSVPTIVDVHWHIIHVSINQKEQTMTLHGHIYMKWFDEFLVWDPKDFNGIHYARVKKWQVWQPKIKVSNSASGLGSAFDFSTSAHVIIQMVEKNRAKVEMYPTFSIKVGCIFDFADYPYDKNKCSVNLFSTATMAEVQLQNLYSIPPTLSFGWEEQKLKRIISDFKINNVSCSQFYYSNGNISTSAPVSGLDLGQIWSMLSVNVFFERHDPLFFAAIVLPSIVGSVLTHCAFLISSKQATVFVIITTVYVQMIFLQDMTTPLPLVISRWPSSVKFFSTVMITNAVLSMIAGIVCGLTYTKVPVPKSFTRIYIIHDYMPKVMQEKAKADGVKIPKIDEPTYWDEFNQAFKLCMAIFTFFFFIILYILYMVVGV